MILDMRLSLLFEERSHSRLNRVYALGFVGPATCSPLQRLATDVRFNRGV
jgi:hypothetical protein